MSNLIPLPLSFKIILGFTAVYFYSFPLIAEEYKISLGYKVYVGGIHTANIEYLSEIKSKNYTLNLRLKNSKIVGLFLSAQMSFFSEGKIIAGKPVIVKGGTDSVWRGKKYRIRLRYGSLNEAPAVKIIGPPEERPVSAITEVMKENTTEVTGAIQNLVTSVTRDEKCDSNVRVYDGKRAFLASLKDGVTVNIKRTNYSIYRGKALRCRFVFQKLGGFRIDNDDDDKPTYNPIFVWFGKPFQHKTSLPVRIEFETPTGRLIAHLNKAVIVDGKKNNPEPKKN